MLRFRTVQAGETVSIMAFGGVAAVSTVEGGVSLFVVGPDNAVHTNYFDPRVRNAWSGWLPLGGAVRRGAAVAAVTPKRGAVSLFAVGADNRVVSAYFDPDVPQPAWSNWFNLGGEVRSDGTVNAVSPAAGAVSLFIRGRDGAVWSAYFDPRQRAARWSDWFSLGGVVRNRQEIVAISPIQGGVSLFQRGDDGHVQSAYCDPRVRNARWSEWFALGR